MRILQILTMNTDGKNYLPNGFAKIIIKNLVLKQELPGFIIFMDPLGRGREAEKNRPQPFAEKLHWQKTRIQLRFGETENKAGLIVT